MDKNVTVKIKGYKKFRKRVEKMRKEVKQLNKSLEKAVELKEKLSIHDLGDTQIEDVKMEIVYNLHGPEAARKLESFIGGRVEPVKKKYPYAKIRIEVSV